MITKFDVAKRLQWIAGQILLYCHSANTSNIIVLVLRNILAIVKTSDTMKLQIVAATELLNCYATKLLNKTLFNEPILTNMHIFDK